MTTIAAISTPPGIGGIAVVRLSGPDALAIAQHHCPQLAKVCHSDLENGSALHYCHFYTTPNPDPQPDHQHTPHDFQNSKFKIQNYLDEVVVSCFPEGHSYTGEQVVEFSCHGSLYVQQQLLQSLLQSGATLAEPGEFTRRAFLNGRLNLSQAEAVADLIESSNSASHALAVSQLRGGYAQRLQELRQQFVDLTALLELELDFSDEDVEFADRSRLLSLLNSIEQECRRLVESFQWGNAIKNGVPVAIVGAPNVGKSTLLNALVGDDRAIVSPIPGTTRDTIEDCVTIDGILFRFIDTAGIRQHTSDIIETEGIQRTQRAIQRAQIILHLIDPTASDNPTIQTSDNPNIPTLTVFTKADLAPNIQHSTFNIQNSKLSLSISARTGQGLDELKRLLVQQVSGLQSQLTGSDPLLTNLRHYEALHRVLDALSQVHNGLQQQLPADLVVIDLREALYHLGTITGDVTSDELLGTIFSRFCIGK